MLDALARRRVSATFFLVGDRLVDDGARALMHEAHAAGHRIGNHTLTHSVPLGEQSDPILVAHEIEETQARLGDCAHPDRLFRPYGKAGRIGPHLLSRAALSLLLAGRYCCVLWNSLPGDWRDPQGWVERCVDDVGTRDWSVVVLHDVAGSCLPRLPELLTRLDDIGVEYRQGFPDSVVLTRAGREVSMSQSYLIDA